MGKFKCALVWGSSVINLIHKSWKGSLLHDDDVVQIIKKDLNKIEEYFCLVNREWLIYCMLRCIKVEKLKWVMVTEQTTYAIELSFFNI